MNPNPKILGLRVAGSVFGLLSLVQLDTARGARGGPRHAAVAEMPALLIPGGLGICSSHKPKRSQPARMR